VITLDSLPLPHRGAVIYSAPEIAARFNINVLLTNTLPETNAAFKPARPNFAPQAAMVCQKKRR